MITRSHFITFLLLSATVVLPCAYAEDVTVQDTAGITRASGDVGADGKVQFTVVDQAGAPAEGAHVSLYNAVTQQTLTAESVGGVVNFQGVTPGTWTVSSLTPGITFTDVTVGTMVAAGVATTGSVLTVGAITLGAGGAIATAIAVSDSSSSGNDLSPAS